VARQTPNGLRVCREPTAIQSPFPGARIDPDVRVDVVTNALGATGQQVRRARADGVDGFVLAGTGLGNATGPLGQALTDTDVPVVITSRCHAGTTAGVYGGPGGAKTLLESGAIRGGDLHPWKARLKLMVALSAGADVRAAFADPDDSL
jgi:L-asparaginase